MQSEVSRHHPAIEWARETEFSEIHADCTTTVVLKILDGKCKMLAGEKAAVLAIYDVVKQLPGKLFSRADYETISLARNPQASGVIMDRIHQLRVYAESEIPKPVMKAYKAKFRDGLFG
ncbi:MAG: hypothetical protein P8Y24_06445 [Gammaproteobacteria bacterium]